MITTAEEAEIFSSAGDITYSLRQAVVSKVMRSEGNHFLELFPLKLRKYPGERLKIIRNEHEACAVDLWDIAMTVAIQRK